MLKPFSLNHARKYGSSACRSRDLKRLTMTLLPITSPALAVNTMSGTPGSGFTNTN